MAPDLRGTEHYERLAAAREALRAMDHWPEDDPDELIPRYFESGVALDMLGYVGDWDLPPDVREAFDRLTEWLRQEHVGHDELLAAGRLP